MILDLTTCLECCAVAGVEWRTVLESTDGPVDHAKVRCFDGPSFLLPTADLASVPAPANLRASGQERPR